MIARSLYLLNTDIGREALDIATGLDGDIVQRIGVLRKRFPMEIVSTVISLLTLREKARGKFTLADRMLFTREGLEQATSENVAKWRASLFPKNTRILDLCCGIGADSMQLIDEREVVSIDIQPELAFCTKHNRLLQHPDQNPEVICADVQSLPLKADAAFFDPSRRINGKRTREGEAYSPPLSFFEKISRDIPNVCVKLSPGMSKEELAALNGRFEFISENGECKQIALWRGEYGPSSPHSATVIRANKHGVRIERLERCDDCPPPEIVPVAAWMHEPDPAIIKGELIPELAQLLSAGRINERSVWLTTEQSIQTPFVKSYHLIERLPFNLRNLRRSLKRLNGGVNVLKCRGTPFHAEDILPDLKGLGDTPMIVIITPVPGGLDAMICETANQKQL